jgi:pimeloyl-ACP methyl ester carboxylesterase
MSGDGWRAGPRVAGHGGVEIATWDLGGDGPPVVLMHATGFHARVWLPLAVALRPANRVWAVDQRGHGQSGHAPDGDYRDWDRFAVDLLAVIDALDLASGDGGLAGAGHSLGGAVLLLAEQRRPGTFRSLYCYEPIVLSPPARAAATLAGKVDLSGVARKRRATFASRAEARANYASKAPFSAFAPDALDAYVEHGFVDRPDGTVELACPPDEEASVYEGAVLQAAWEGLAATEALVTMARGADTGPPAAGVGDLAGRLPHGRLEAYEQLSHFGPMEDPLLVGRAVARAVAPGT